MTPTFLVCGTDTEVGKTVLSALLLQAYANRPGIGHEYGPKTG